MSGEPPTGIGVIGLGHWGKHYVRIFDWLVPEASVIEVSDLRQSNLAAVSQRHPLVNVSTQHTSVIENPRVEAVVIATPAATHYAITREALLAGKHVLVEKPLTLDIAESAELAQLARAKGRVLLVGHTFLYNPAVRKVKEIIDTHGLGQIYYLSARRNNLGPIREDASAITDLAPHDLSIFNYLLAAEPLRASAVSGVYLKPGRPDVAFITLEYPGGVLANIQVSWIDSHKIRELVVIGSERRVVFDDLDHLEPVRVFDKGISVDRGAESFGEFQYQLRDGAIQSPKVESGEPLRNVCQHFLDCVRRGVTPLSGAENGLGVVRALAAIERSAALGGRPVDVPAAPVGLTPAPAVRAPERAAPALEPDAGVVMDAMPGRTGEFTPLVIGPGARVRSGSVLYRGSVIGRGLETGHGVVIREECRLGDDVRIWNHTTIDYGVTIGDRVRIHCDCYIAQGTTIEDDVFLAPGVKIANDPHPICYDCLAGPTIRRGARIGIGAILLPGIEIGAGALVGAGAVVTHDVPPRSVVYGNPARVQGQVDDIPCPVRGRAYPAPADPPEGLGRRRIEPLLRPPRPASEKES